MDWREVRRRRAWDLKQNGWKQSDIAEALGVSQGAVSQWLKKAREQGVESLAARKASGRPAELSAEQKQQIPGLLSRGPEAYGFRGAVWTRRRVAVVLYREFGVRHCPQHVGTLLRACGWTRQKPVRRARQRDGAAVEQWVRSTWPGLKKSDA